jgi:hypothetical protein
MKNFSEFTPKQKYTSGGVALTSIILGYYAYKNGYLNGIYKKKETKPTAKKT